MKFKAKMEVEFEFEADNVDDAKYQGRVFLQTQLHRNEETRKIKIKRYDIDVIKE